MSAGAAGDEELRERIDELCQEVRRQGRAAVAAQAAAESCLERLSSTSNAPPAGAAREDPAAHGVRWLRALLPLADALDRTAAQAAVLGEPESAGLLARLRGSRTGADARALAEAVRVLRAQLGAALEELGVIADRPLGRRADPEQHRVVETRTPRPGEVPGMVVEVVRPGYRLGSRLVREADVVATSEKGAH